MRLRITCKLPPGPDGQRRQARYPWINAPLPDWGDVEVMAVADDGTETALTNVSSIRWEAAAGLEPTRAYLTFEGVGLEVETEADES